MLKCGRTGQSQLNREVSGQTHYMESRLACLCIRPRAQDISSTLQITDALHNSVAHSALKARPTMAPFPPSPSDPASVVVVVVVVR